MHETTSPYCLLALALAALPLASAASCPFARDSQASEPIPADHRVALQNRAEEGSNSGRCPRKGQYAGGGTRSSDWWPCEVSLAVLRQNSEKADPYDSDFDYAEQVQELDGKSCLASLFQY